MTSNINRLMMADARGHDFRFVHAVVCSRHVSDFHRVTTHRRLDAPLQGEVSDKSCVFCDGKEQRLRDLIVETWGPPVVAA